MTECERLLKEGRFTPDFFKEEVRCDFKVDKKRKKIWAVELDLLLKFDEICKKYNLKYFVMGGTLIGAIRHHGFIPWDDDIDVAMLRDDYEKFISVAVNEFKNPYLLQLPQTDKGYFYSFAKLRNVNTTAISYTFKYADFNQGIFIDIFPLDNCLIDNLEERFNRINKLNKDNSTYMRMTDPNPSDENKKRIDAYSGRNPMDVYIEIQKTAMEYRNIDTEYVNTAVFTAYKYDTLIYRKEWFDEVELKEFEGVQVPIPRGYDGALRSQYGNYMILPPMEKRGIEHSSILFEPDIPFEEMKKICIAKDRKK